jgi:hypothetical protein
VKIIKFIQNKDGFTMDSSGYPSYVNNIKEALPGGALQFMIADWHYDHRDPRCPHDAKIDHIAVKETAGQVDVEILLNGPYEGKIRLNYSGVQCYTLEKRKCDWPIGVESHGDWMIDEMLLEDDGILIHEIAFSDALLKIKHKDFKYSFEQA